MPPFPFPFFPSRHPQLSGDGSALETSPAAVLPVLAAKASTFTTPIIYVIMNPQVPGKNEGKIKEVPQSPVSKKSKNTEVSNDLRKGQTTIFGVEVLCLFSNIGTKFEGHSTFISRLSFLDLWYFSGQFFWKPDSGEHLVHDTHRSRDVCQGLTKKVFSGFRSNLSWS